MIAKTAIHASGRDEYVVGEACGAHKCEVDFTIEGDSASVAQLPNAPVTEIDRAVGMLIAGEIADGVVTFRRQ